MKKWPLILGLSAGLISVAAADVASMVQVDKPFARAALQQQRNSAIFMQLSNGGSQAALVSAQSPASKVVELHTHRKDNGVMRMRKIDRIELPAGQDVNLKPGGLHIMLIGLERDLTIGENVEVTLQFSDGSSKQVNAPIHKVMRKHSMKPHQPMMHH